MVTGAKKVKIKYAARLKQQYSDTIISEFKKDLDLRNVHDVPKLEKIVLNVGLGRGKDDKKLFEVATNTLRKISGQQPIQTYAKKSIAAFKLRAGNPVGLKVTLRGERMYEFGDRFINLVLPRLRDFHGVREASFDKSGNYNVGLIDQSVFPELSFEETTTPHGIQVVFVIKSKNISHAQALLIKFGMPFEKPPKEQKENK